ncbi:glucose dehydrogenase [FAD, quinone]-like [Centruroides vittatus]|uniref:glucose dehydrogenase [FAD, quinone]-like n=1 Tax=Centruroides vittatus TaxID=120091 RepID=UPI00350F4C83
MHIMWLTNRIENTYSNANDELQNMFDQYKDHDTITCFPTLIHPQSRGSVTLNSSNPYVDPVIDLNILSHPDDVKILVEGMKYCLTLASTKPMRKLGVRPLPYVMPGCEKYERFSDEHLTCMALAFPFSIHHFSGTCKMGDPNDPTTVVDASLKVKGVHGLRVVDTSIIPILTGGYTMTVTMMIADKAADIILHQYQK